MNIVQSAFFVLASIYLLLGIVFLVFLIVIIWKAYKAVVDAQRNIAKMKEDVEGKVAEFVAAKPSQFAKVIGSSLSVFIIGKIKDMFNKSHSSEPSSDTSTSNPM